ncbi:hypothetical protein [Elioraea rosea]|uniref:hypothetical protein n=1 Tax=Elioraea rosea TaxID=2492390 RepID=UPI0013153600|nr:hypothetical protein [Elioraea rosea]
MNPSSRLAATRAAPRLVLGFALAGLAAAPAQAAYWNLFNFEGESALSSVYVTYDTLTDMLNDTNRTGGFQPGNAANNVVGSDSDGTTWWSVFNFEGESEISATIVTYGSLIDMLNDTNRTGGFQPGNAANNVVGTGSDGETYWSVFNFEGESQISATIVTYDTLTDMLNDTNRTGGFQPGNAANNVVGSGADIRRAAPIPEPGTAWVVAAALAALGAVRQQRRQREAA